MKKNFGKCFGLARCGAGAVIIGLCAFIQASRADVAIVDNTSQANNGFGTGALPEAVMFTMGNSGANISSLTLVMSGSGSSEVYVYNAPGGAITAYNGAGNALYDLGSISASSPTITIGNPSLYSLSANSEYAIVLADSGSQWGFTASPSFTGSASTFAWNSMGIYFQMDLVSPVPEVPVTGIVMGFGALAIAVGHTLRRKLRSAVSGVA